MTSEALPRREKPHMDTEAARAPPRVWTSPAASTPSTTSKGPNTVLYLSDDEAEELYDLWHEQVACSVRRAHAKANGRRDTHDTDLASLRTDLLAINLHTVGLPEPDAASGTALESAQSARRFLAYAEEDHARAEHLTALLWLQGAFTEAKISAELDKGGSARTATPDTAPHNSVDEPWCQQPGIPRQRDGQ